MNAITIGFRHDGKCDVLANADVPAHVQVQKFRDMQGPRTHPVYRRVELYSLANADRFVNYDAPKAEAKPTQPTESKGKTK